MIVHNKKGIFCAALIIILTCSMFSASTIIKNKTKDNDHNSTLDEFIKKYNLKVTKGVKRFYMTVPKNWDMSEEDYPIGLYWQTANVFSKDVGLDLTKLKGSKVEVFRYSLLKGIPMRENKGFTNAADLILLVKSNRVAGAYLTNVDAAVGRTLGPSVRMKYFDDITGMDFDEWADNSNLFSDNCSNYKNYNPEEIIKEFCKDINENNKKKASAFLSYSVKLKALNENVPDNLLYNKEYNFLNSQFGNIERADYKNNIIYLGGESSNPIDKIGNRKEIQVYVIIDFKLKNDIGQFYHFCKMYKTKNGWKLCEFKT